MSLRFYRVLVLLLTPLFPGAQSQIHSARIFLPDWGIDSLHSIRLGQVSTIHREGRDETKVYALYDDRYLAAVMSRDALPSMPDGNCLIVSPFEGEQVNTLGGGWSFFERSPSSASVEYARGPDDRRALRLSYDRQSSGFCGMWMRLFRSPPWVQARRYFDARPFGYLTFWIRGAQGGETLRLKAADDEWDRKEDSLPIGEVGNYCPGGRIETAWQLAVVPLTAFPRRLNLATLATLVFEPSTIGRGQVELKSLAFCKEPTPLPSLPEPAQNSGKSSRQKGLWVWNTSNFLGNKPEEERFLTFLRREKFSQIFLALPYDAHRDARSRISVDQEKFRPLMRALNTQGFSVHALMGDKDFILPENRQFVKNSIEEVIRYNRSVELQERFFGIHLDVEPYLFGGFNSPRREWFLQNFLLLLSEAASAARLGRLHIGADIPTWFDAPNDLTQESVTIDFQSVQKPLVEHIVDLMDHVVLMDYRTEAGGQNGIIAHALGELAYASAGKKVVYVGIETEPLPDETVMAFRDKPLRAVSTLTEAALLISLVRDRDSVLVSIVPGTEVGVFKERLRSSGVDPEHVLFWPVAGKYRVKGEMLSFANIGPQRLSAALKEAEPDLTVYPAFAGFAIHHYDSYRKLLKAR